MQKLNELQRDVNTTVDRLIGMGAWPFGDLAAEDPMLVRSIEDVSKKYSSRWTPPPPTERR